MPIGAIETRYAGCRFRSRLEARWAVFFDALGIAWEYEPQGFQCSYRLSLEEGTFPYLPDFWLPDLGLWAEVKGTLDDSELLRLLNAAAHLSVNGDAGCGGEVGGHDVLVLGHLGRPEIPNQPVRLHMHKGDLYAYAWPTDEGCRNKREIFIAADYGGGLKSILTREKRWTSQSLTAFLLDGFDSAICHPPGPRFVRALTAARSARFEHGETPTVARG